MRPYYTEYANHMMQKYCETVGMTIDEVTKVICTDAERNNWNACNEVWKGLSDSDRMLAQNVFSVPLSAVRDALEEYATAHHAKFGNVWKVYKGIVRKAAEKRGLV